MSACSKCGSWGDGCHCPKSGQLYAVLPPLPKANRPEWATFIAGRSPDFKMHNNLGHAKSAIHSSGHGIIYRWMSEWEGREANWTPVAIVERDMLKTHPAMQKGVRPTEPVAAYVIEETP